MNNAPENEPNARAARGAEDAGRAGDAGADAPHTSGTANEATAGGTGTPPALPARAEATAEEQRGERRDDARDARDGETDGTPPDAQDSEADGMPVDPSRDAPDSVPGDASRGGSRHEPRPASRHEPPHESAHEPAAGDTPLDELALRRMLHTAVEGMEPSGGTLDHLRTAIPARRARKRQALVGAAAAALLFGTAVPAFLHVAGVSDASGHRTVRAGGSESESTGTWPDGGRSGDAPGREGGEPGSPRPGGVTAGQTPKPHREDPGASGTGPGGSAGSGPASSPGSTFAVMLPVCTAGQLGVTASKSAPTANGTVYGSFHVSNVSATECTVTGSDTLGFVATGAADPMRISVVQHTAGDPATQLPDTSEGSAAVALAPATAYEVQFAFVPSATCPTKTEGGSGDPTPPGGDTPGNPSSGGSPGSDSGAVPGTASGVGTDVAASGTGASTGLTTQLVEDGVGSGGGTEDGSVSVSHTPEAGVAKAETTITNACAGTIYKTGPVDAPAA
ncbi:hypothetical protein [Streptomyces sp. NBC_01497]|uniref:hypothetical protein n=1 Tax=Streptomyces sp. NBC_01497 TaxID=2903885 RepID=UPI002E316383|nr:hypothetical protein [Streptomyces sp. NBC_01497]